MKISSFLKISCVTDVVMLSTSCTRIQTGEVGVRVDASKQIQGAELMPGTFNQTVIGEVVTFPVRDITLNIDNKNPTTADNTALADFDITMIYAVNPTSVAELYGSKSKSFHYYDEKEKDTLLMYNYLVNVVNNAAYKAVRQYKSLEVADNRQKIELEIVKTVQKKLKEDKLDAALSVTSIQIRAVQPNQEIVKSAAEAVKRENELRAKTTEVEIAKKEAERMKALADNGGQSIAYMQAQAQMTIAQAVKDGKVQTIIIPSNLTMLGNVK